MLRDFKCILLLLLVSTLVFAESRSKYGKLEELLKTLGKRYTNSGVFRDAILFSQKQMRNWMNEPDDYIAKVKLETAELITQHIRWQSSVRDNLWRDHASILMELQDDRMTAEVCGAKEELNKVKFNNHLKRLRGSFDSIQDNAQYSFEVEPTAKDILKMISRVELKSQWGYTITQIWNIHAKLQVSIGCDEVFNFLIFQCREGECAYRFFHIKLGGGCTEYGIVNHNYTEMNNRKEALKQLKEGTNTDFRDQDKNELPYVWLQGLDTNADSLKIYVCHENEEVTPRYTREQFRSWYGRFMQMWYPKNGDTDYLSMQVLDVKPNEIAARITMRLQIGVYENATIHEWNMKVATKFNEHADNKWYITRVEVLCQPDIRLMDEHYLVYRDVVGATFMSYIKDADEWYTAVDFGKRFRKGVVELNSCGTRVRELEDLPNTFFINRNLWNATITGYLTLEEQSKLPAQENFSFVLRVAFNPITPVDFKYKLWRKIFGSDWTFHIRYDKMDQFYYIYKMNFDCPRWMETSGEWIMSPIFYQRHSWIRFGKK
ncbi:hypothetical protein CRE_06994 [Caenorhabditis remanei]|uniref:NTF2-like domain-containing protein n=1 Tax=Caenorhabditis remanei TaxID=31234 RepID=E3NB37_CAERE|nr:hypothetical protein CRE_06994 [Caenorhabditis remanei]